MPFIIKSAQGRRSYEMVTNKTTPREDIAEALKGLTFKFEVKIVDVIRPQGVLNDTTNGPQSREPLISDIKPVTEVKKVQVEETKPKELIKKPVAVERDYTEVVKKPVAIEPKPVEVEKKLVKPKEAEKKPLKLSINKGELKIGTDITTCCCAVDDRVNPPEAYISYDTEKLYDITSIVEAMIDDIENQAKPTAAKPGDIMFAKSTEDGKWYRSMVECVDGPYIDVYFFDWGLRERLSLERLRALSRLDLGLSNSPACALKVKFTNDAQDPLLDAALQCTETFNMRIISYDEKDQSYVGTILSVSNNS